PLQPALGVVVAERLGRVAGVGEHEGRADAADPCAPARQRCTGLLVHRDRVLMLLAVRPHAVVPGDRAERLILGLLEGDGLPTEPVELAVAGSEHGGNTVTSVP